MPLHARRVTGAAAILATMALAAGCGSSGSGGGSSSGGSGSSGGGSGGSSSTRIASVIKGLDNPFFQSMQQGIQDQGRSQGTSVTVQAAASITDTTGQADKLNTLAGQDFGCFVVNPITGTNLIQPLAQLSQRNKPVVNIDSPIDAGAARTANLKLSTYIGTDNVAAGTKAAQTMLKSVPSGQVAVIGGTAGDVTSGARIQGFKQGAGGKLGVVQTVAADWDRQKALTAAGDILRAHTALKGFFVANDDMALGVVRAAQNAGRKDVKVVSVDGIKDALQSIRQGGLTATVSQYPYTIGQMGTEACKAAATGKKLPAHVNAPVLVVTKANAAKALQQFPKPFGSYADPFKALIAG